MASVAIEKVKSYWHPLLGPILTQNKFEGRVDFLEGSPGELLKSLDQRSPGAICIIFLSHCCVENSLTKAAREEGLVLLTLQGYSLSLQGNQGSRNLEQLLTSIVKSRDRVHVARVPTTQHVFSTLTQSKIPCLGDDATHSRQIFPPQLMYTR